MQVLALAAERKYWQKIMIKLAERGINFSHVVVQYRYPHEYNEFFDRFKPIQINGQSFYRLETMQKLVKEYSAVLDAEIISGMQHIERDFYTLTDRFSYFPKSFRYRKRLLRECLRYWFGFFAANKIDKVFISCTPHNLSDFVAYNVARYLGIPTVQIYHTMINDYIMFRDHYGMREVIPPDFLKDASEEEIIKHIPPEIYQTAFQQSQILKEVVGANDVALGKKGLNVTVKKKKNWQRFGSRLYRTFFQSPKFKTAFALNGVYTPTFRRLLKLYDIPWKKRQKEIYQKLATMPDLKQNYIYFAMHLQPERTSTPEAELFEDQLMAIEILSKAVPEGWKIYVKENPRQFDKRLNLFKSRHARDESDYRDMLKLPNVELIRMDTVNKDVRNNAQLVATLAGSIGWEMLMDGKPALVFGNAWYASCQSCFVIDDVESAKTAIAEAMNKTPQDVRLDILRYLAFIHPQLSVGDVGEPETIRISKKSPNELEDAVVNSLFPLLNSSN